MGVMATPSSDRILTTHTGSLARPPELVQLLSDRAEGRTVDEVGFRACVRSAMAEAVRRQVEAGIDVVSDGEMGKPGFANYVMDRMTGFGGEDSGGLFRPRDVLDFPELERRLFGTQPATRARRPANDGPIAYVGGPALAADLADLSAALTAAGAGGAFVPAASPGCVVQIMPTTHYATRREYLFALAEALRVEYRAIVEAGFLLQVDCPDLAMGRHVEFGDRPAAEFHANLALHVAALNHALEGIPQERVRVHVCWGNYAGPHHRDVPLREILPAIYDVNAAGISIEAANPRHEHEWTVFRDLPPPPEKYLIPGVIDSCTNYIEHPEVVAQRLVRFAETVGRERVVGGTDCGFATFAGFSAVVPDIAYAKLSSLAEGAHLATTELWGR
ncbi:MAG TPA: cobalamin-independent methionine synthase II family protein [Candidatus Dormibacteraeota bacterium]|nr:cobalamin-independent methionine synthase II family protein [Candidatus Dormibacteraeota bacterium]